MGTVYGPLMKPSEFKALPSAQRTSRLKEFYGSAWRDRCDVAGGGGHSCQNPQEHQEAYDYMKKRAEARQPGERILQEPAMQKALRTHQKHQAPDFEGAATGIGGPLSDYHGYTAGKRNPNPWPAK